MRLLLVLNKTYKKSILLQSILHMIQSNLIVALVGLLGAFVQARFVSPDELGFFRQFSIITGYLLFFHLGSFQAIERLYPQYIGNGESNKGQAVLNVAKTWIVIIVFPAIITFATLSLIAAYRGDFRTAFGWLAQAFLVFTTLYGGYIKVIYRVNNDFKRLARYQLISPLYVILVLPVFAFFSYFAMFLKSMSNFVSLVLMIKKRTVKSFLLFDLKIFTHMVKVGFPLFLFSFLTTSGIEAVRATLVLRYFGLATLGYWSFGLVLVNLAKQIPQSISAVFYPRIVRMFAETSNLRQTIAYSIKPFLLSVAIVFLIIPLAALLTYYFVPIIVPNYANGVHLVVILIFTLVFSLLDFPTIIMNILNLRSKLLIIAIIGLTIEVCCFLLLIRLGYGIYSIPISMLISFSIKSILYVYFLRLSTRRYLLEV